MPCPVHDGFEVDSKVRPGAVPRETLDYWRAKGLRPGFDYRDVWKEEHDLAFTAAKVMRLDVLEALQAHLDRAIAEGKTFKTWQRDLQPTLEKMGWWAPHTVVDPKTGRKAKVDPPSRLKKIFDTNMRTARAAGQWERIERNAKTRPYILYQVGPSARHREEHLGWHGLMLPVDDEFWSYAMPPNGWNCRCFVLTLSRRAADRIGEDGIKAPVVDDEGRPTGEVEKRPVRTTAPKPEYREWKNKRTGKVERVPKGIDPGFHHRPGDGRRKALEGRLR